ncbi:MAG: hypothetical protein AAFR88_05680 [Pseudomonadota bacterium]
MSEAFRLSSKHIWILDELLDGDIALLHIVQRCQAMGLEAWEGLALLPELYCEGIIEFFERNQVQGAEGIAWKPERDFAEVLAGRKSRVSDYKFCVELSQPGQALIEEFNHDRPKCN